MTEWYVLPGMGASSEMYDLLKAELSFEVIFLNWPYYRGESSYREIAERIISENQINENDIVGGSSLGGMIALEMAMFLNTRAVILIGSALNRNEINKILTRLSFLASATPFSFLQVLAGKRKQIVYQMFSAADQRFIRAMCKSVQSWSGYHGPVDKVYRIHGQKDHIIPCPEYGCEVVKNAGHLVAMTHPEACAAFFEKTNLNLTGVSA